MYQVVDKSSALDTNCRIMDYTHWRRERGRREGERRRKADERKKKEKGRERERSEL